MSKVFNNHIQQILHVISDDMSEIAIFLLPYWGIGWKKSHVGWALPKMEEKIFGEDLFDVYFDYLVWPMSPLQKWRGGIYDLYCSLTPGGDQDVSDSNPLLY